VSFAAITLCVVSRVFIVVGLSPETFGYICKRRKGNASYNINAISAEFPHAELKLAVSYRHQIENIRPCGSAVICYVYPVIQ
jgi:hypothetical protein